MGSAFSIYATIVANSMGYEMTRAFGACNPSQPIPSFGCSNSKGRNKQPLTPDSKNQRFFAGFAASNAAPARALAPCAPFCQHSSATCGCGGKQLL